jgi:hypothetical protein
MILQCRLFENKEPVVYIFAGSHFEFERTRCGVTVSGAGCTNRIEAKPECLSGKVCIKISCILLLNRVY